MRLAIAFIILLWNCIVRADVSEEHGSKKVQLLARMNEFLINKRIYHSPAEAHPSDLEDNTLTELRNIFAADDRIAVTSTDAPWRWIGKLSTLCTGSLVGPDLVLTAAHCVIDAKTHQLIKGPIVFNANMINGKSSYQATASYIWWGTTDPDNYRAKDWALIRLNTKLGNTLGWFGAKAIPFSTMKITPASLVGYSTDFRSGQTAGLDRNCHMMAEKATGFYIHDCDATRGASGGPMFASWSGQYYIFALHVGEYRNGGDVSLTLGQFTDANGNIAIWSQEIVDKISYLRTHQF